MTDRKSLAEAAGKKLTGRRVVVRDRAPVIVGRIGQASNAGIFSIIDIDPTLNHELWLKVFLHECAHARLHFEDLPPYKADLQPQSKQLRGLEVVTSTRMHPKINKQEEQAEEQADHWLRYAEAYYKSYGLDSTPLLLRKLQALSDFHPYHATINKAVDRVVTKAVKNFKR